MALQDLNRAGDTTGDGLTAIAKPATNKIADITPKNWRRFPLPTASMADANPNDNRPRYNSMTDWTGGVIGDDIDIATATVALARNDGGANEPDYAPRHQAAKATLTGNTLAVDISRARGWIAPNQPYQGNATAPAAPTITSLAPNTAVAGVGPPLVVDITGTGFTPYSTVLSGNYPIPSAYVSPTVLRISQWPRNSVAGTVQVVVIDHDVNSAPSNFVFT
jgi:hypothetical protein